jgi:hypothetical protein
MTIDITLSAGAILQPARLTSEFTGPPSGLGFQENPGSAAPVQQMLGRAEVLRGWEPQLWPIVLLCQNQHLPDDQIFQSS